MTPSLQRGTNISHWLSQSKKRGPERKAWFTRDDIKRIAAWAMDHIRLPIDEEQMWDEAGQKSPEAWTLLDSALDWCRDAKLNVIVDLHILRSHYFNDADEPRLFHAPKEAERFAGFWAQLSDHLRSTPKDAVAYELMNEPVAKDPNDWNRVAHQAYHAIRDREPDRTILLGSNRWNSCDTFDALHIPADKALILTFHFYNPMLVTHYKASWWREGKDYTGPTHYPGTPIAPEDWNALTAEQKKRLERFNKPYDREAMRAHLAQPLAARKRTGNDLYCGEFGCLNTCPQAVRLAWYRDLISLFTELKIGWGNWDYKGSFGLITADGKDTGIAAAMLGK